jgi:phosphatidylglycerol:prolipoprotein diacylglycerol transferase
MAALAFPAIDPVFFSLGPLEVRWYGLAYVAGFVIAGLLLRSLNRRWGVGLSGDDMLDIVLAAVIGLMVGARLGYVLFYGTGDYWSDPLSVLAFWDGGMSFHGGLIGIMLAGALIARRKNVPLLRLFDLGAVGAPVGLFLGRVANFINGELWGRPTDVPWGVVFPGAPGAAPRHPSQLYEALLEGVVLLVVLLSLSRKKRPDGVMIGTLLALYGIFRIFVEFFREPDIQLGFVAGSFTMGQFLSLPMVAAGVWLIWRAVRSGRAHPETAQGGGGVSEPSGD